VTFETDDNYSIRFEISNNSSAIRFGSIRNENHYSHSTKIYLTLSTVLVWNDARQVQVFDWPTVGCRTCEEGSCRLRHMY